MCSASPALFTPLPTRERDGRTAFCHPERGHKAESSGSPRGHEAPEAVCSHPTCAGRKKHLRRKKSGVFTPRLALCCARRDPYVALCCAPLDDACVAPRPSCSHNPVGTGLPDGPSTPHSGSGMRTVEDAGPYKRSAMSAPKSAFLSPAGALSASS